MDPVVRQSVLATMRQHGDEALHRLVALEQTDYDPAALTLAKDELRRRGLPILSPDEYWQRYAANGLDSSGFCKTCYDQTTMESPSAFGLFEVLRFIPFLRFLRPRLLGEEDRCEKCKSVVKGLWVCLLLPVVCLARYRVISSPTDNDAIAARRIKGN
jgi:hypothetical protein